MIKTGKKFSKPDMSRVINGDTILSSAPEAPEKFRLDHLLVEKYPSYNRSTLQKFIESGFVTVEDKLTTKPNQKFEKTAKISLVIPEDKKNTDLTPDIIYEDENVIVLNKPAGLLSMAKGDYCPEKTLEDFGLLVHRLDRDTSGVVILAKNPDTQAFLRKQFQDRKAHKVYYAIVEGRPKLDEANIDLPIARDLKRPTTFRVDASGRPAETYYKVVNSDNNYSLLELHPKTGRTHQLRVHLNYIGCPILGDRVYGHSSSRLFLHAYSLEITLPGGIRRTFSSDLPKEFKDVF